MIRSTSKSAINLIMSILSTFGLEQLYVYELKPIFSCIPCGIRQSIKPRPKTKNEYIKAIAKYLKLPQLCDGIAKTRTLLLLDHLQVHLLKNSQLSYDSIEKKRLWKKLGYSTPINDHERQIIYAAAYCYKDSTYVASRDIYDNRLVLSFSIDQLYNPMAFLKENANLSAKDDADDSSNVNNASIWLYIYDYDQLESICLVDALSNQATLLVNGKRVAVLNQEHSTKYDYGVDITSCLDINKINNWLALYEISQVEKKFQKLQ
ncbi:hypothetical protein BDF19DRAFT_187596 [Syncephalis fuscata]|nr:hypothetical protein BDF19DRAFT_187596 [Syncephalis fuscata]